MPYLTLWWHEIIGEIQDCVVQVGANVHAEDDPVFVSDLAEHIAILIRIVPYDCPYRAPRRQLVQAACSALGDGITVGSRNSIVVE